MQRVARYCLVCMIITRTCLHLQQQREEQGSEKFDEWIQWLCVQLRRHQEGSEPAYRKYREWTPPSTSSWLFRWGPK